MYPDAVMRDVTQKAQRLGPQWASEMPARIHSSSIGLDGAPAWHPEFERWLIRSERPPALGSDPGLRTTRVMRKLRKLSKREYEVCYRLLVLRSSVTETTGWLNQRARSNGIAPPPGRNIHYTEKDTLALFIAGIDWADANW